MLERFAITVPSSRRPGSRSTDLRLAAPEPTLPEARRGQVAPAGAVPHRSFWLQQVEGDAPDAPPLQGDQRAEIAILGGGYVGLWTALRIKALEPSRDVAVLEQDICGGRCVGAQRRIPARLVVEALLAGALCGAEDALHVARGSEAAIGEIRHFCAAHASMRTSGRPAGSGRRRRRRRWARGMASSPPPISSASSRTSPLPRRCRPPHGLARAWRRRVRTLCRDGRDAPHSHADCGAPRSLPAWGDLRAHARAVVLRGTPVILRTERGRLTAEKLVIASNAWAAGIHELARAIVATTSDMVVTPPAPEALSKTAGPAASASPTLR